MNLIKQNYSFNFLKIQFTRNVMGQLNYDGYWLIASVVHILSRKTKNPAAKKYNDRAERERERVVALGGYIFL